MRVIKFVAKKDQKLSEAIYDNYAFANYNFVQKLLRNRDVKINGKRVSKDETVKTGFMVEFYFAEILKTIDIIFEDSNIIIAFKPRQIESVSEDSIDNQNTFKFYLEKQLGQKLYAVHRLDRNTEGLILFAKNIIAKDSLDNAIKNRQIKKYYLALVSGNAQFNDEIFEAYLKKDSKNIVVKISDKKVAGSVKIQTQIKSIKKFEETTMVEIKLITGKTHQIRAHLSFLGYPIIGDEKYGDSQINKKYKKRFQCLSAYKLDFNFSKNDVLSYLNGKSFEINKTKIDFCKNL